MPNTLVIDSDPEFERFVRDRFSGQPGSGGHHLTFVHSDEQALTILNRDNDLDIVIVAIDRPGISGMPLFHRLDKGKSRIPRIALSGGIDLPAIRRAMNDGAADFLIKPVSVADLQSTLDKVFQECERRRETWRTQARLSALQREVDIAAGIQRRILPTGFPHRTGLEMFAWMHPAKEVGGDFYDFFELSGNRLGLVVADVVGKGIPAAFFMAVAHTLIRATGRMESDPAHCIARVNTLLCHRNIPGMLVSVFYAVLDFSSWELVYVNAGHPPPLLIQENDGAIRELDAGGGPLIGIHDQIDYESAGTTLEPGENLFIYTDGLSEAFNPAREQFSSQRLIDSLRRHLPTPAPALAGHVFADVRAFAAGAPQSDDMTGLVIRRLPGTGE